MFNTIRSRLLLSYTATILALFVVAVALFWGANRPDIRYKPALQQMGAIGVANRYQIKQLRDVGAGLTALTQVLDRTAAETGVRIVVANATNSLVVYDTAENDGWVGETVEVANWPRRFLANAEQNTISGRFHHSDGSNWLVYSPPIPEISRLRLFYIQPEPTLFSFFREYFFSPLLGAGIAALIIGTLMAVWIASGIARPLRQMAGAAEAVAQGDYDHRLNLRGPEEVRRVAHSFNSMAAQVSATQQAQRDFVANVSHDLKTPITSIQGWSQALLDGTAASEDEKHRAARVIHNETNRMARMVSQLLDLARIESGQLKLNLAQLDLAQVLADVHQGMLVRAQEAAIHLTLDINPVRPVRGDHDRLMQVLTNLVDNALTHTSTGGRVHLSLSMHGDRVVEVVVQDTGAGIPPAELSRIFERFYQVDKSRARPRARAGSGLGLSIVKELVEAHNGRIQAHSQVGVGTAFTVRLPIDAAAQGSTVTSRG